MMKISIAMMIGILVLAGIAPCVRAADADPSASPAANVLNFTMKDIDGKDVDLSKFKGSVIMMVNVASRCGNTPQYTALEKLYKTYKEKGFVILAFPANNFHAQEPGTNAEIKEFCTEKYNVTFPIFSKISVKGDDTAPLYKVLTSFKSEAIKPGDITWNFEKFIIARDGTIADRFTPRTKPDDAKVTAAIETELAKK